MIVLLILGFVYLKRYELYDNLTYKNKNNKKQKIYLEVSLHTCSQNAF